MSEFVTIYQTIDGKPSTALVHARSVPSFQASGWTLDAPDEPKAVKSSRKSKKTTTPTTVSETPSEEDES